MTWQKTPEHVKRLKKSTLVPFTTSIVSRRIAERQKEEQDQKIKKDLENKKLNEERRKP